MRLSVLLSAMYLEDETYIDSLNITSDAVVVNQCYNDAYQQVIRHAKNGKEQRVTYIESTQRGLSKSRNMAIEKADSDICILCDNDVVYEPGYEETIMNAYRKYKKADVIIFFIKRPERQTPVFSTPRRMSYLSVLKIFSPEISFKKSSIAGFSFNERYGAGAIYKMGEENLFLYDLLKSNKQIYYVPTQIATLKEVESTWFTGYDRDYFIARGANYRAMTKMFCDVLIWQFALRKQSLYIDKISMKDAIKAMYEGKRQVVTGKRRIFR